MGRFEHLEISDPLPPAKGSIPPAAVPDSGIVDASTYVEMADAAFDGEDFELALAYYSRSLQYDATIPHAWAGQVRCLIELRELPEAITWSDRAMERFPESPEVLAARGVAEGRFGRHQEALRFVDAALALPGASPEVWIARGDVLLPINATNARRCFVKALESATDKMPARTGIARSMRFHGCWHLALEQLRGVVHEDPSHALSWFWIGRCCEELGEPAEADRCYHRALEANPRLTVARDACYRLDNTNVFTTLARRARRLFHRRK